MYLFARLDQKKFNISDDEKMVLDLLKQEKILIVHGSAFNWPDTDHFRVVFLPHVDQLSKAMHSLENFFGSYHQ
jgi:alanine-synthesizing transaminase